MELLSGKLDPCLQIKDYCLRDTRAFYDKELITAIRSFMVQSLVVVFSLNLFSPVRDNC